MFDSSPYDVVIVGGGVAGRSAGTFTARHGLDTAICNAGSPILRRNAHIENFPGFPAGVNPRLLLDMMAEGADRAGCERYEAEVTRVETEDGGFVVETAAGDSTRTEYVVAASKNTVDYLDPIDGVGIVSRGKEFVDVDEGGRTGVDGLYAAGRIAEKPHQAVVAAGHGAEVAVSILEDDDRPFYHDWVAPDRYFTGRGRDLPPGCEEIGEEERRRREEESLETMREHFERRHPDEPEQHPSVTEED
ncbi:thioredoxin reductase [Halobacteriales archaeon QS_8_69_26]|nr:MAG: thioredoxin reductase [Halobacteriales archaeon QS_8_69_26]